MFKIRRSDAIISASAGILAATLCWYALDPIWHLSNDRLYVFIGDSCKKSTDILAQLETDAELREHVVPVIAEEPSDRTRARVCTLVLEEIERGAPWLFMPGLGQERLCRRVEAWSRATYQREFVALPAWSEGRAPVSRGREAAVLAKHGLRRRGDEPLEFLDRSEEPGMEEPRLVIDLVGEQPAPPHATSHPLDEWRGFDIGF